MCFLQYSCSKNIFGKLPRRPASVLSVLKMDSTVDALLGNFQRLSEQLFFQNTNENVNLCLQQTTLWKNPYIAIIVFLLLLP